MTRTQDQFSLGTEVISNALDDAIEQAVQQGRTLEASEHRLGRLCMLRTYRSDNIRGLSTISASLRIAGDIVLGPFGYYTQTPSMEALKELISASRWVYHPLERGGGTRASPAYTLRGLPSLQIISRIELSCRCGYKFRAFRDLAVRNARTRDGRQAVYWAPDNIVTCSKCQQVMAQRPLWCSAGQDRKGYNDDPVLATDAKLGYVKEQILEEMLASWEKGAEKGPQIQLPRIWALYAQGTTPDPVWCPDKRDSRAHRLADFYQNEFETVRAGKPVQTPLSILPFEIARQYHQAPEPVSQAAVDFVVEAERFQVGWVQMKDLLPNRDAGFKRQLWDPSKESRQG